MMGAMRRRWPVLVPIVAVGLVIWLLLSGTGDEDGGLDLEGLGDVSERSLREERDAGYRELPVPPVPGEGDEGLGTEGVREDDPRFVWGRKFFEQAIRYVSRDRLFRPRIADFEVRLDAKLEVEGAAHEGQMRFWYSGAGGFRWDTKGREGTTSMVLNGEKGWLQAADGRTKTLGTSREDREWMRGVRAQRAWVGELADVIALQPLRGGGARFRFDGYKRGSGTYAGEWAKVTRLAPGQRDMLFWFAYERGSGNEVTVTWPGIVRIEGNPQYPTEDYILREWDSEHLPERTRFRYPRRIEAYAIMKDDQERPAPRRFFFAIVEDIRFNAGFDAKAFDRPAAR
jgi:hypothetical protein